MKILIVKTSSLGDLIQTFPVLDYLRKRFPNGMIDWVVESPFAELLRAHPQLNQVLTLDSKKWRSHLFQKETLKEGWAFRKKMRETRYDLLFDLQGNTKSGFIAANCWARKKVGFGHKTVAEWPNVLFTTHRFNFPPHHNIREDYLAIVKSYFRDETPFFPESVMLKLNPLEQQKFAEMFRQEAGTPTLVCPSAAWPNKCLTEESLVKVLTHLNQPPYWFIWGNLEERKLALRLASHFAQSSVLERLSLPLLQHVMSRSQLVVAMDSLPLHLCGTTKTPSLSFFGPSSAAKYRPLGHHHLVIQGECPYGVRFEKRCPKLRTCATGSCLKLAESIDGRAEAAIRAQSELYSCEKR